MYEAFYGLNEKPFNLTPDPRFLYLSEKHREAFAHLLYGIRNRSGFVMVTGAVGTGKTTICRTLLNRLDEDTEVAFIFNPRLSCEELLSKINEDFGVNSHARSIKGLVDELNEYLLERAAEGKNCLLVIDEAQNLTPSVLEQVRLLSNLETETDKLLQIVLIGQPELLACLELSELKQLNQRITARYHLKPLNKSETLQYIAYRLRVAGGRRKARFSRGAVRTIYRASGGVPRVINAICDRALLIGYTKETKDITKSIARRAVAEVRGERVRRERRERKAGLRRYLPSRTLVSAAILVLLAGHFLVRPVTQELLAHYAGQSVLPPPPSQEIEPLAIEPAEAIAEVEEPVALPKPIEDNAGMPESTFGNVLNGLEPGVARNAAAIALLRAWDKNLLSDFPIDDSLDSLAVFADTNGLSAVALSPTFDQFAAIDLPAFAKMAADTRTLWVGLLGMDGDEVRLTTGFGGTLQASREEFEARYLNQVVILWRDRTPDADVLQEGMSGQDVARLQRQLQSLGRLSGPPSGVYDKATVAAIEAVQDEAGLTVDGKTGNRTRMVLSSWLPDTSMPSLRVSAAPEQPPEVSDIESEEPEVATADSGPAETEPALATEAQTETQELGVARPSDDTSAPGEASSDTPEPGAEGLGHAPSEGPAAEDAEPTATPEPAAPEAGGEASGEADSNTAGSGVQEPGQAPSESPASQDSEPPAAPEAASEDGGPPDGGSDAAAEPERVSVEQLGEPGADTKGSTLSETEDGKVLTAPSVGGSPLVPRECEASEKGEEDSR